MAKEQEAPATTTMTVSRSFSEMVLDLARDANKSVRAYCDEDLAPMLRPMAKKAVRRRLAAVELGGEG